MATPASKKPAPIARGQRKEARTLHNFELLRGRFRGGLSHCRSSWRAWATKETVYHKRSWGILPMTALGHQPVDVERLKWVESGPGR